jgi:hypothetical protein
VTFADFAGLVEAMREAQRAYFKARSKESLIASKQLESRVDKAILLLKEQLG